MKLKIVLILSLVFQFNFAQEINNEVIKPNGSTVEKKWEVWQEKIPISGNVRVGLMVDQSTGKHVNPEHFYAIIPKDISEVREAVSKILCVELSSKDGRYSAKIDYTLKPKHYGQQEFEIPTKYKNELSNFTTDEVVILASLGVDCTKSPKSYVISSWFKIEEITIFSVYLNSIIPTRVALGESEIIQCQSLKSPIVAYNKKCSIKAIDSLYDNSIIHINQRRKRGSSTKIVNYKIPLRYYNKVE